MSLETTERYSQSKKSDAIVASAEKKESEIDIFSYIDYREYIKDQVQQMQSVDKKYSQRWIAKRAGFKSPQMLSMIIAGQRGLSKDRVLALADVFKLEKSARDYFEIIVDLGQCEDSAAHQALLERIKISFKQGLAESLSDEGMEMLRDWYIPVIRELVTLKNFEPRIEWMSEVLSVPEAMCREAVQLLLAKGFLRLSNGQYERTVPSVHNHRRNQPLIVARYHLQMIERAIKGLTVPMEQRYFESLTVSAPKDKIPEVRAAIQRFCREMDALLEASERRDEVYQLNVQFFPLTEATRRGRNS